MPATQVQLRRDVAADIATFVGAEGEAIVNKDTWGLHIMDGITPGGHPIGGGVSSWSALTGKPAILVNLAAAVGDGAVIKTGSNISIAGATSTGLAVLAATDPAAARAAIGASDGSVIQTFNIVADQAARLALALSANPQMAYQDDNDTLYVLAGGADPSVDGNWQATGGIAVVSFNGRTGAIVPQAGDYTATLIAFTPTGTIAATTVHGAIAELDDDLTALTSLVSGLSTSVTGLTDTAPVTVTTGTYSVGATDDYLIFSGASTCSVTLPNPASTAGQRLWVKRLNAYTVTSSSTNVKPIGSATAGTAILPATAGAWAILVSDGASWVVVADNSAAGGGGVSLVAAAQNVTTPVVTAGTNGSTGSAGTAARSDHTHPELGVTAQTAITASTAAKPLAGTVPALVGIGSANRRATLTEMVTGRAIAAASMGGVINRYAYSNSFTARTLLLPGSVATSGNNLGIPTTSIVPNIQQLTLTANCTITMPSLLAGTVLTDEAGGLSTGMWFDLTLWLVQDATGGRTVTFALQGTDTLAWDGSATAPAIATGANKRTGFQFIGFNGSGSTASPTFWVGSRIFQEV